jgi:CSLREA domain-containing protein
LALVFVAAAGAILISRGATSAAFDFEFTVDSTADTADASPDGVCDDGAGACTLRSAIEEADSADGDSLISFNIPGDGPHTISPQSSELLPVLNNVTLDGYTQPGISMNTLNAGDGTNAVLMIEIDGSALGGIANGITMIGTNSVLKGLAINNFGGSGVRLLNATANRVAGNFIGTDVTGTSAEPNGAGVTLDDAHNSTIGTTAATDTNIISGNGVGIVITGESEMNVVRRNLIGTQADGVSPLPNASHGILMTGGADCNTIGGLPMPYRNVIAFNGGDGIALATDGGINNYVDPNFIHDNGGLGVDINDDGPTMNDPQDTDTGANDLQNFPVLTSATNTNGLTVTGHINSTPRLFYNLFFLVNDACDSSGYGEGQDFVGDITIIADETGDYQFTATFPAANVPPGKFIAASASNPESTSEFSLCVEVVEGGPTPTPGPVRLHGDVRCDGEVDATDGLGILREVAGMPHISHTEPCPDLGDRVDGRIFGDVLCNGGIDAVDALAILRFVAGLPPLPAGIGCPDVGEEV